MHHLLIASARGRAALSAAPVTGIVSITPLSGDRRVPHPGTGAPSAAFLGLSVRWGGRALALCAIVLIADRRRSHRRHPGRGRRPRLRGGGRAGAPGPGRGDVRARALRPAHHPPRARPQAGRARARAALAARARRAVSRGAQHHRATGLPADHEERGRGFRGMAADAQALGGMLSVRRGDGAAGTTIICAIPLPEPEPGG